MTNFDHFDELERLELGPWTIVLRTGLDDIHPIRSPCESSAGTSTASGRSRPKRHLPQPISSSCHRAGWRQCLSVTRTLLPSKRPKSPVSVFHQCLPFSSVLKILSLLLQVTTWMRELHFWMDSPRTLHSVERGLAIQVLTLSNVFSLYTLLVKQLSQIQLFLSIVEKSSITMAFYFFSHFSGNKSTLE